MKYTLTLLLILFYFSIGSSKHILSSEMTYECLSEGEYKIDLTLYRDCLSGGANFDTNISIAIYENEDLFFSLSTALLSQTSIIYNPYEDCNPNADNICVERGEYSFIVELPVSDNPYTIAYQRCCWADDILNITEPGNTGITASTTISPLGQSLCNKQTALDFPLAFASCPGNMINFQLPTEDEEGDILEYQLCLPYQGGGILGSGSEPGDPLSCEGLTPTPACPPPYSEVELAEGFDIDNPFPTEDGITLDSETGVFSFTPSEQGRYIYSICYSEIRDGQVIGLGQTILQLANIVQDVNAIIDQLADLWKIRYVENNSSLLIFNEFTSTKSISIFSSNGSVVHNQKTKESYIEISTFGWSKGVYYIQLTADSRVSTKKVVVY